MSMHRFRAPVGALCAAALCLIALPAKAQTIQPGLWEVQTQMQGGDPAMAARAAEAQKRLANLPPEQRKMVESMMGNMKIQPSSDGTNFSMKLCLTKEMVERDHIPQQKEQHGCKNTYSPRLGGSVKFSFQCPDSRGDGVMTYVNAQEYHSKIAIHHNKAGEGAAHAIREIQSSGRWQGNDCGTVKPMEMPKPQ